MAKLAAHGRVLYETEVNANIYRVMEDGVILWTWRSGGKLQGWTIRSRRYARRPDDAIAALKGAAEKRAKVE